MKSTRFIGNAADRTSGVYNLTEINEKIQDQTYPTNYEIENSCRFDGSSALENDNSTQNNPNQYTISGWTKLNNVSSHYQYLFSSSSSNQSGVGGYWGILAHYGEAGKFGYAARHSFVGYSTNRFRDTNSWYHFVFVWEKSTSKIKYYVNGQLSEEITGSNFGDNNSWMNGYKSRIGCRNNAWASGTPNVEFFQGYMADIHFIDGQALDPTHFAHSHPSTGRWSPKRYQGTYGTNGFHLEFKNTGTHTGKGGIGEDTSGNGNHWAVTGLTAHDITPDSPSNNFLTWNSLDKARDNTVLSDGNLTSTDTSSGYSTHYGNIIVPSSGLYYVEFTVKTFGSSNAVGIYVGNNRTWADIYDTTGYPYDANTFMLMHNGLIYYNGTAVGNSYHPTFAAGDIVALVIDASTRNFWLKKNGSVTSGDNYTTGYQTGGVVAALPAASAISALPAGDMYIFTMASGAAATGYSNSTIIMNAGQDPTFSGNKTPTKFYTDANNRGQFYYPPPAGALALCEKNLNQPQDSVSVYRIDDTNTKALTYTGNIEISKFTPYAQDGYSIYFNGVDSYINWGPHQDFVWGTDDFTIEFWIYIMENDSFFMWNRGREAQDRDETLYYNAGQNRIEYTTWTGSANVTLLLPANNSIKLRTWQHVAIVYQHDNSNSANSVHTMYIDGVSVATDTGATDINSTNWGTTGNTPTSPEIRWGRDRTTIYGSAHYMSGLRVTKQAVYTTTFTPPTSITNAANVKFLTLSTERTIKDSSSSNHTVTLNGTPSIDTFSPYTPKDSVPDHSVHGGSFYLDGNGDKIVLDDSDTWSVGNGDFTFKFWMYGNDSTNFTQHVFAKWNNNKEIRAFFEGSASNRYTIFWFQYNTSATPTDPWVDGGKWENLPIVPKTWNYFVLRNSGGTTSLHVNGVSMTPTNNTISGTIYNSGDNLFIGSGGDPNSGFAGYIADFEFEKTAVSDATVVPTSKVSANSNTLLLLQPYHTAPAHGALETLDSYNKDETGKQLTYIGNTSIIPISPYKDKMLGSFSFDGVWDYLTVRDSDDWNPAGENFTVEGWFYLVADTTGNYLFGTGTTSGTEHFAMRVNADNTLNLYLRKSDDTSASNGNIDAGFVRNKWNHVCVERYNNVITVYVNGVGSSDTFDASGWSGYNSSSPLSIGAFGHYNGARWEGYITDFRFVKGAAVYQGNFTPPYNELASISYTKLLLQPSKTTSNTLAAENPEKFFKTVTWTGTGSNLNIDLGFNADFVWTKRRNGGDNHLVFDSVRGEHKALRPDLNGAYQPNDYGLDFINNNARLEISGSEYLGGVGGGSPTFVAWCWQAGGAPTTDNVNNGGNPGQTPTTGSVKIDGADFTGSLPTAGIYPTRMSVNTKAGFSIIKYQGASASKIIPHGLNTAPEFIIIKNIEHANGWVVGSKYLSSWGHALDLSIADGEFTAASSFDSTAPTSTVFTLGNTQGANDSSYNYIAYCWHAVPGYSKFGNYIGNSSSDGPFIYTGFKPAWVLWKRLTDDGSDWGIVDAERNPINVVGQTVYPSISAQENTNNYCDFLSNGFKIRGTSGFQNATSKNYIYMAFAEQPFTRNRAR